MIITGLAIPSGRAEIALTTAGLRQLGSTATADMLALNAHDLHRGYMGSQFVIGHWEGSGGIEFGFAEGSHMAVNSPKSIGMSLLLGNASGGLVFIGRPGVDESSLRSKLVTGILQGEQIGEAVRLEIVSTAESIPPGSPPANVAPESSWTLWGDPFLRGRLSSIE